MGRQPTPSKTELDGFKLGDLVRCGYDREPLTWRIIFMRTVTSFRNGGAQYNLVDLGCVDVGGSTKKNHRVGMARSSVSTTHLSIAPPITIDATPAKKCATCPRTVHDEYSECERCYGNRCVRLGLHLKRGV